MAGVTENAFWVAKWDRDPPSPSSSHLACVLGCVRALRCLPAPHFLPVTSSHCQWGGGFPSPGSAPGLTNDKPPSSSGCGLSPQGLARGWLQVLGPPVLAPRTPYLGFCSRTKSPRLCLPRRKGAAGTPTGGAGSGPLSPKSRPRPEGFGATPGDLPVPEPPPAAVSAAARKAGEARAAPFR